MTPVEKYLLYMTIVVIGSVWMVIGLTVSESERELTWLGKFVALPGFFAGFLAKHSPNIYKEEAGKE